MAVRIRLKKMGRKARPFYRVCAMDSRSPRDGKVIEELGYYDPMVPEKDARVILKRERVDYWLGVGAQPTPKTGVLLRKYGTNGSHLEQQKEALERLKTRTAAKSAPAPSATEAAPAAPAEAATATAETPAEDSAEGGES
ncbi:MAG: 30S ribosomal protein S16 [Planctomycetota bacterium]|nr:30S ribosomal protein S16 [Planctomycetota bacterium]